MGFQNLGYTHHIIDMVVQFRMKIEIPIDRLNPLLRLISRPENCNTRGDAFGGWLMAQFDLAGAVVCGYLLDSQVATVAIKSMRFYQPVYANQYLDFELKGVTAGRRSLSVQIQAIRLPQNECVAEAELVYAAISQPGKSMPLMFKKEWQ